MYHEQWRRLDDMYGLEHIGKPKNALVETSRHRFVGLYGETCTGQSAKANQSPHAPTPPVLQALQHNTKGNTPMN